ncbi:MAG: aldo/keto reductase [Bacillota bacterium]
MEYRILGNTGLNVSRLCFGGLTVGPLQANLSLEEGGEIIAYGFSKGINFIDTAELYGTYGHIRRALEIYGKRDIVIASKSYAYDVETAKRSLDKALDELKTDKISIFLLHEQESEYTIKGHYDALAYYLKMKEAGIIDAVGISTHTIRAVEAASKLAEIGVIHPIINKKGLGIADGSIHQMLQAIETAYNSGKGIYGMKPLGGGNLIQDVDGCFRFVLDNPHLHAIAVGMQTKDEVLSNVLRFEGQTIPKEIDEKTKSRCRRLHIDFWCEACGKCVDYCSHKALKIVGDKLEVNTDLCVLCGYCSKYCPNFCIKVV